MKYYIVGALAIASLVVISNNLNSKSITESKNARFNEWVSYYSRCEGYTVEYYNFDTFSSESDIVTRSSASGMAGNVQEIKQLFGFVTVYFDWERDIIFYRGSGPDSKLLYCFYSNF